MTLTEFLLARIAEDEDVARACLAEQVSGRWEVAHDETYLEVLGQFERPFPVPHPDKGLAGHWFGVASWESDVERPEEVAAHIARHDPARVLAECEAKRRIVGLHHATLDGFDCARCDSGQWDEDDDGSEVYVAEPDAYPCETMRLLALPYADHPDYQPEWSTA